MRPLTGVRRPARGDSCKGVGKPRPCFFSGIIVDWCMQSYCFKWQSDGMKNLSVVAPRPTRLRTALRLAIDLRVKKGMTISAACEEAEMSPQGFHKAMKRPEVRDYLQSVQMEFVASVEGEKAIYKARAFEVGMELMLNSKSEAVRARMVEFFASDGKVPAVSVHIDARQNHGYEYVRPGQQVVEVRSIDNEAEPLTDLEAEARSE